MELRGGGGGGRILGDSYGPVACGGYCMMMMTALVVHSGYR